MSKKDAPPVEKRSAGRPKLQIDGDQVYKLASLGLTNDAIAEFLNCTRQTIEARFPEEIRMGRSNLRETLMAHAVIRATSGGSDKLLCLLLKNMCGLSEKVDHTHDVGQSLAELIKESFGG